MPENTTVSRQWRIYGYLAVSNYQINGITCLDGSSSTYYVQQNIAT